jgi:hypothetical protein
MGLGHEARRMTHPDQTPKRHKKQPTADCMREQLALAAADEIIRLRTELEPPTFDVPAESFNWEPGEAPPPGYHYFLHADGTMTLESPERLAVLLAGHRIPWYRRLWHRIRARLGETGVS